MTTMLRATELRPYQLVDLEPHVNVTEENRIVTEQYAEIVSVDHETDDCVVVYTTIGNYAIPADAQVHVVGSQYFGTFKISELNADHFVNVGSMLERAGVWNRTTFYGEVTEIMASEIVVEGDTARVTLRDGSVFVVAADNEVDLIQ